MHYETTLKKFQNKDATIAIVGLGYVGIPLAEVITQKGFKTIGVDIDPVKVDMLNQGRSYLHHIEDDRIQDMLATKRFEASENLEKVAQCDAVIICVPTPLGRHHEPVLSFIENAGEEIYPFICKGQLIVLESSSFPGTTTEILKPILEKSGLIADKDFFLAFSPEREDPGNQSFSTSNIPKIIGGDTPETQELVKALYSQFIQQVIPVDSTKVAEAAKLLENIYRAVNISLINELKIIFDPMDIDIWKVIDAAKTKPFGFMPFYPGPGIGGHCIPLDPYYLTWKSQENDMPTRLINIAGEINERMPHYVLKKTGEALDKHAQKGLNGSKILIVGVAYKKNIDDYRESPALKIADLLHKRGARLSYFDPLISELPNSPQCGVLADHKSIEASAEHFEAYDAILITVDHDTVDYQQIADHAHLIVDTRNVTANCSDSDCIIVKA
ncbi:MAG: UDP-N-acetyl-D-glucosamine dehydrogenase [Alphaproteobacteria bacterium]|nr:MAG: UDP-N-acetyl-D-glucosamine dehydrogenase [Alphaproteobacteria bacterium]